LRGETKFLEGEIYILIKTGTNVRNARRVLAIILKIHKNALFVVPVI
jgi:hypothetical protein